MAALSAPWTVFVVITITAVPADAAKSTGDCAGIVSTFEDERVQFRFGSGTGAKTVESLAFLKENH